MVIALLIVAAVIVVGLFLFVPSAHQPILNAFKTAVDDLDKINTDAKALLSRVEGHAAAQTSAADDHTKAAAVFTAAAATATTNAATALKAAEAIKAVVADIKKV